MARIFVGVVAAVVMAALGGGCKDGNRGGDVVPPGGTGGVSPGGSGGSGGTSGSGGQGGSGDAGGGGDVDGQGWLLDERLWPAAEELNSLDRGCVFRTASAEALDRFPLLEWTACGDGCEKADVAFGGSAGGAAIGVVSSGRTYLSIHHLTETGGTHDILMRRIIDLESRRTVAVIQVGVRREAVHWECNVMSKVSAAPLMFYPSASVDVFRSIDTRFHPETGAFEYLLPAFVSGQFHPRYTCDSVVLEGVGPVVHSCPGYVLAALTPGSSELTEVSRRKGWAAIAGLGEHALYVEARGKVDSRLLQWSVATGEEPASVDIEGDICVVGMGNELMVGVLERENYGSVVCAGFAGVNRLVVRRRSASDLELAVGPLLTDRKAWVGRVVTWGRYIAATVAEEEPLGCSVVLVRLDDWAIREIGPHPSQLIGRFDISIDGRYLYVAETPEDINLRFNAVAAFYRYELSSFESLGEDRSVRDAGSR